MAECSQAHEKTIEDYTKSLPPSMKEAVEMCYRSSQVGDKRGLRYTNKWILECLLLRIKSPKAYSHLRDHNILVLPTNKTLDRYMQNLKPSYGFDPHLFETLKTKVASMKPEERRGKIFLGTCYFKIKILIIIIFIITTYFVIKDG